MQTSKQNNWLLILGVVSLATFPLLGIGGEYIGTDKQAQNAIAQIQPDYQPWFSPLLELPSQEVESLLFVAQGSLGAGIVGYVIGLYKGRNGG
jgi:cobalt/nickel transport protein